MVMLALGDDCSVCRVVCKPLLLAIRRIAGQRAAGRVRQPTYVGRLRCRVVTGQTEPKASQRREGRFYEGLKEQTTGKFLVVIEIRVVAQTRVADPIENPCGITDDPAPEVAVQFKSKVAIRHECCWQGTFVEQCELIGLELFEANR